MDELLAGFIFSLNRRYRGCYKAVMDETTEGNWLVTYQSSLNRVARTVYDENTKAEAEVIAALCNLLGKDDWDVLEPLLRRIMPESFPTQEALVSL